MKAVRFHEYGGPEVLVLEDVPRPVPGQGEVLVKVAATSFNPLDAALRAGLMEQVYPLALPHTPGYDVAGVVAELGPGVTTRAVGDRVVGFLPVAADGAAAEYVVAAAQALTPAPANIPLADAGALPAAALIAWQSLFEHAKVTAGQRVLVNGAGGGVGTFAIQLAKIAGAFVIATASPRSAEAVRGLGADEIIDYTTTSVADALGDPVDAVLNAVRLPAEAMPALVAAVRPGGVLVTLTTPAEPDTVRDVTTVRPNTRPDTAQLAEIVALVDSGRLTVDVTETVALADLPAVHTRSAAGQTRGKIVVTPQA